MRRQFERPGDLLRLDVKKLGRRMTKDRQRRSRGAGWDYVHVAVDDRSPVAFTSIHPDETGRSACQALLQAVRHCRSLDVRFTRAMTDNGACTASRRFRRLGQRLGLRHVLTKPYTPQTNGKAERFTQTSLRE